VRPDEASPTRDEPARHERLAVLGSRTLLPRMALRTLIVGAVTMQSHLVEKERIGAIN
jgi:hypothetical protein